MSVIKRIEDTDAEAVKKAFSNLMRIYLNPAFGSISKRDFDISLFMTLQDLGIIDKNPEMYELVSELKVTRAKARNLLYEAKLRTSTKDDLDEELKELLKTPIFLKENEKIGIEIGNPYLIDHLRQNLKELNHITDGSFSPELVKLTTEAYLALFEKYLPDGGKEKVIEEFVAIGVKSDGSFKGVMTAVLTKLGTKVADEAGGEVAKSIVGYLGPVLSGSFESIKELFTPLFEENEE